MTVINTAKKRIVLKRAGVVVALCWTLCSSAQPQQAPYTLVDLGVVGPAGQPFQITNKGIITAAVQAADGTDHAVIYFQQHLIDISKPGLGGANSMAIGINGWGQVVGGANTPKADPHGEDFCGFQALGIPSATASCLPFLWQGGKMIALPTLDDDHGNNGMAYSVNDFGEVAGAAENTTLEPSCPAYDPANMQFQRYQFKPVVWRQGGAEELGTVGADPVGWAKVVNDRGQAVGATGTCAVLNFLLPSFPMHPLHAVLWERDGTPIDLKSLGGNEQSMWGNVAEGLNNSGHVVGSSSLSDNVTFHAFFWTRETGKMQDLGPFVNSTGITNSLAIAINDGDDIVGVSTDLTTQFVATIWKHGVATDLNTLIPANSPLYLLSGCSINASGQIIGLAIDGSGAYHGYELTPAGK
jgi:probable HAF family extracellular repeat protein